MDSAQASKMRQEANSDLSFYDKLDKDDKEELITLLLRLWEDAYNEGFQDGVEAPPPEPSHHYE